MEGLADIGSVGVHNQTMSKMKRPRRSAKDASQTALSVIEKAISGKLVDRRQDAPKPPSSAPSKPRKAAKKS